MDSFETTATAAANNLVDEPAAVQTDVTAEELMGTLSGESGEAGEHTGPAEAPAQGAQDVADGEASSVAAQPAADDPKTAIMEGIRTLHADGWTPEELTVFSQDENARADIAGGKTVMQAANAYMLRMMRAGAGQKGAPAAKASVPTFRQSAAGGAKQPMTIDDMTDEQFDAFSKRARELAQMGKRVKM